MRPKERDKMNVVGIALFAQVEDMRHVDWEKVIRDYLWGPSTASSASCRR